MKNFRTGTTVNAQDYPTWGVIDEKGKVLTYANTREWAREFASHEHGERIVRINTLVYTVSK